jgi:hypothetical protein
MAASELEGITRIDVEPDDFDELVKTIVEGHALTTFFTNEQGSIFVPPGFGYTKMHDPSRNYDFAGKSRLLDAVAKVYRKNRPEGGRFRLDRRGASRTDIRHHFVVWNKPTAVVLHVSRLQKSLSPMCYRDSIVRLLSTPIGNS